MNAVGRHGSVSPLVSAAASVIHSATGSEVAPTSITGAATTISDPSTGAVMHFPSHVWQPHQGEQEWPGDAWTEPPEGGAKWWGPPSSLQVYSSQTQTGDEGRS